MQDPGRELGTLAWRLLREVRPRLPRRWLTVLRFQRLGPDFDAQLRLVRDECSPLSLEELVRCLTDDKPLPPRAAMLSFDGGLKQHCRVAVPALRRHALPAAFFLPVLGIEDRKLQPDRRLASILRRATGPRIELRYPFPLAFALPDQRRLAQSVLERVLSSVFALDLERFFEELETSCGSARAGDAEGAEDDERERADAQLMTWDEAASLTAAGFSVGPYTSRPPEMVRATDRKHLLTRKRQLLVDKLGVTQEQLLSIALPGSSAHDVDLLSLRDHGFKLAFTTRTGSAPLWSRPDPLRMPRVDAPAGASDALRAVLHAPHVFRRPW